MYFGSAAGRSAVTLPAVARIDELLPDEPAGPLRRITIVTRRDIFGYLRTGAAQWHGGLDEITFLSGLYDLDALPSTDPRHATASEAIAQHRFAFNDWHDTWVSYDERFRLADGPPG
jgi:hypothetical protein